MKIIPHITFKATTNIIDLDKPLAVLSGTRDEQVKSKLESLGYRVSDKFSKDAKLVVIPNPMFTSSKVDKAKKYGIEVKTVNQIQNMGV
jgi:NAD-dependent DNA ligase